MHRTYPDPVVLPYQHSREQPASEGSKEPIETTIEHYKSLDEYEIHTNLAGALQ